MINRIKILRKNLAKYQVKNIFNKFKSNSAWLRSFTDRMNC